MKLVFLYGPAAAGKLTVGREVSRLTGIPLFHNHLVVDAVSAVFPFGSPTFVELRHEFWLRVFDKAAAAGRSLIFTFTPEPSVPATFVDEVVNAVKGHEGEVVFVRLMISLQEQERRIEHPDRSEFNKLRSLSTLLDIRKQEEGFRAEIPEDFAVDTEENTPSTAAQSIVEFLASTKK